MASFIYFIKINRFRSGGTSAYHPRMMIKILLNAYSVKIYTGRRTAGALRQDVAFGWLAGHNRPGFRTINNFRSGCLKRQLRSYLRKSNGTMVQPNGDLIHSRIFY
ncbi:transposase [Chitinophaga sp. OAE865]|uniref:transposase n=1 Tax=Chitinophaga sp. OAE865 TaxID=2817898 RepID=UPI003392C12A